MNNTKFYLAENDLKEFRYYLQEQSSLLIRKDFSSIRNG